jgi:hypothetical protein
MASEITGERVKKGAGDTYGFPALYLDAKSAWI